LLQLFIAIGAGLAARIPIAVVRQIMGWVSQ
jgi:hypothetical protein